jgi:ribosomal protein L23
MNINRPVITEKSLGLASRGWYTFAIGKFVRKNAAAKEIERMYHVNVLTARVIAMHGKVRRTGKKMMTTRRADWKKIMVLLKQGQHIDAFEVTSKEPVAEEEPKKVDEKKTEKKIEKKSEEKKLETQQKGKRKSTKD